MNSVAISVTNKKVSSFCELPNRDSARIAYKCPIMVRPFVPTEPKEEEYVEMPPADKAAPDVDLDLQKGNNRQHNHKHDQNRI